MFKLKNLYIVIILLLLIIKSYGAEGTLDYLSIPSEYKNIFNLPIRLVSGKEEFPKFDEWVHLKSQISDFLGWNKNSTSYPKEWAIEELTKSRPSFRFYTAIFLFNSNLREIFNSLEISFSGLPSEYHSLGYKVSLERRQLYNSKISLPFEIEKCIFLSVIGLGFRSIFLTHEQLQDRCKTKPLSEENFYKEFMELYFGHEEFFNHCFITRYASWFIQKFAIYFE